MLYKKPSIKSIVFNNKTFSFVNLCVSSWLFVSIFMFNKFNASLNSTSFKEQSLAIFLFNNTFTDILYQSFGNYIYFLPFPFLFWSYQYFFQKIQSVSNLAIVSFLVSLVVVPTTTALAISKTSGGLVGLILYQETFLKPLMPAFIVLSILLCINSLNISIMVFVRFLILTIELLIGLVITFFSLIKTLIKQIMNIDIAIEKTKKETPEEEFEISILPKQEQNQTRYIKQNKPSKIARTPISETPQEQNQTYENSIASTRTIEVKPTYKEETSTSTKQENSNQEQYFVDLSMLNSNESDSYDLSEKELITQGQKIEAILNEFGVTGVIDNIQTGPLITLFEFIPASGIKISKVVSLETDIALKLKVKSVRISPVSGKNSLGLEVPNKVRKNVLLKPLIKPQQFRQNYALPIVLGKDIAGAPAIIDLAKTPHMLVGGTTGSGKSVSINTMIISLISTLSPNDCKLIMIDPKMLELSVYEDIPHLLTPVVTNPEKAVSALKWAVREMEFRYFMMSQMGVRNIVNYNQKVKELETPKKLLRHDLLQLKQGENVDPKDFEVTVKHMPYVVVVIDEMADLMLVAGKEVEMLVQRLAQMARAAGIHVIMATQRPSVDVITGTIKANFPTRVAFQVSSKIDSRTILGNQGAESLLGKGDMLVMLGGTNPKRVHGAFVSDKEVEQFVTTLKANGEKPTYVEDVTSDAIKSDGSLTDKDELYDEVVQMIQQEKKVSTSFIQRKFQIGYNRAARIVDQLEESGIISPPSKTGKRDIFI